MSAATFIANLQRWLRAAQSLIPPRCSECGSTEHVIVERGASCVSECPGKRQVDPFEPQPCMLCQSDGPTLFDPKRGARGFWVCYACVRGRDWENTQAGILKQIAALCGQVENPADKDSFAERWPSVALAERILRIIRGTA